MDSRNEYVIGIKYRKASEPFSTVKVMAYTLEEALAKAHKFFECNHMQILTVEKS